MAEEPNIKRSTQQIGGALFVLVGLGFTVWTWYTALTYGYFYSSASLFFPAIGIVGLGLILFPDYKTERIARGEDISQMEGLQLLTPRWRAVLVFGLLAGIGNFAVLYFSG